MRDYVRYAALGDSTTFGIGDPVPSGGWRGWARLLADALGESNDVSFCNLAVSGATSRDVVVGQLEPALSHRPTVASLVVGINDTMRSTWDPARVRQDLMSAAEALTAGGALLLTVRFHDHAAVLGLPGLLRRPMARRIEDLNRVYDEVDRTFGGVRLDLVGRPEVRTRAFWSVDRLHPSELGHRSLARQFGTMLADQGMVLTPTTLVPDGGVASSRWSDLRWMVTEGAPWFARRARDLGPWAVRLAAAECAASRLRVPRVGQRVAPGAPEWQLAGPGSPGDRGGDVVRSPGRATVGRFAVPQHEEGRTG